MRQIIYVIYNNKKYPLVLSPCSLQSYKKNGGIHVFCEEAGLDQDYMMEDIGELLKIIPDLIKERKELKKEDVLRVRISPEEKIQIEEIAQKRGFKNISSYIRSIALQEV